MNDKQILIGRLLLACCFVFSSLYKLSNIGFFTSEWTKAGLSATSILVIAISLIEPACVVAIVIGYRVRLASYILAAFMIMAIPVYFDFWNANGEAVMAKLAQASLYLSVAGGFLLVAATGAGRYAIRPAG
jgi:putative oxidoreductase